MMRNRQKLAALMSIVGALGLSAAPCATWAATFTVTTVADTEDPNDGYLSLREAINAANANQDADVIHFDIDNATFGPPPHVILVGSPLGFPLPPIVYPVVIDGNTDIDYAGSPVVVLDGTGVIYPNPDRHGLHFESTAGGSAVRGLGVRNFPGTGISMYSGDTTIEGNVIEGNAFGLVESAGGILISVAEGNHILSNVVSGNQGPGIYIGGNGGGHDGLHLISDNLIVGNTGDGVTLSSPWTDVLDNVISGNGGNGVSFTSYWAYANRVQGNFIGTDENGTDLGNGQHGVMIVGSPGPNTIGIDFQGSGANVIAHNGGDGVYVQSSVGNSIRGNSIFDNAGLGIDLAADGVTPNDGPSDLDPGANNLQNFPVLLSAVSSLTSTTVQIVLETAAMDTVQVDLYGNDQPDPSGHGEGQTFFASKSFASPLPVGPVTVTFLKVPSGKHVTATATIQSNTSEFGPAIPVIWTFALVAGLKNFVDSCEPCPPWVKVVLRHDIDLAIQYERTGDYRAAANALRTFVAHTSRFMESGQVPVKVGNRCITLATQIIGAG